MQELKERIVKEGKVLPGNIIKVDGFLNHRIDTELMTHIAEEFGKHFNMDEVTTVSYTHLDVYKRQPFTPSKSGQRLPPTYYRGCWHVVSRGLLLRYRHFLLP